MPHRLTVLCDNYAGGPGLVGEHGFSLLIETAEGKYLFDTGAGLALPLNLNELGRELKGLRTVFLSHGHYDHTGGLAWVGNQAEVPKPLEVIAHPQVFLPHMGQHPEHHPSGPEYIGCPATMGALAAQGLRFRFIGRTTRITPLIHYITGIERSPDQLPLDTNLVLPSADGFTQDPMPDDASLLLETDTYPVLILGCAHSGVLNILDHIGAEMGIRRLKAILGGTHLMFFPPEIIPRVIAKFEEFDIEWIGVSHCTGMAAAIELGRHFGPRFMTACAGLTLEV